MSQPVPPAQSKMPPSQSCRSIKSFLLQKRTLFMLVFAGFVVLTYFSRKMFVENMSYPPLKTFASGEIDFSNADNITGFGDHIVPDIVHFIHFDSDHLSFIEVVNIRAAFLHHVPEKIMIHCNFHSLSGKYWDMVKDIPVLELKYMEKPTHVFGKKLTSVYHSSDVARIKALMEYGGIFLDSDSYVVRPLDDFRKFEMTLGWHPGQFLGTQILIAHRNARFLKLWFNSYKYYRGDLWYFNAGELPTKMFLYPKPELVHRIPYSFGVHTLVHMLYRIRTNEWNKFHCIHLLIRHKSYMVKDDPIVEFDEENIKTYNKTFGEMARLVLYGTSVLITDKNPMKIFSINFSQQS